MPALFHPVGSYFPACLSCGLLSLGIGLLSPVTAAPHRYDHVVIVIEENTDYAQVLGNRTAAPYINSLADQGVNFTEFYGITHPSQPNYIHLFCGDHQGIDSNSVPVGYPFSTPNLGAALLAAGCTFGGYSEDLPAIGDRDTTGTDLVLGGITYTLYRRKHNPWANWQAAEGVDPLPVNQLPYNVNLRFTDFPTNFAALPNVSIVVPNQQNDMHDGTVRMGDDWLRAKFSDYVEWAKTHNSLFVLTFDEDNLSGPNKIPTVFAGAGLTPGTVNGTRWTLHNLLRTLEDMYGTYHSGRAAKLRPITGVFPGDPPVLSLRFRQGLNAYTGCTDTMLRETNPAADLSTAVLLSAEKDTDSVAAGDQTMQILLKYASIFGSATGQVPANATVVSAKLSLWTGTGANDDSDDLAYAHRVLIPWASTATWNALVDGIATDETEALAEDSFSQMPELKNAPVILDVTADIAAFLNGTPNHGWVINLSGDDAWNASSSESASTTQRPTLQIAYTLPTAAGLPAWQLGKFGPGNPNADPEADPDGDGASNLLEYALNANPLLQNTALVRSQASSPTNPVGIIEFRRNLDATDVSISVETAPTLDAAAWTARATWQRSTGWSPTPGPLANQPSITENGDHVTLSLPQQTREFVRIKAALVTGL